MERSGNGRLVFRTEGKMKDPRIESDLYAIEDDPIPIVGCHLCEPDKWKAVGGGKGLYECGKCGEFNRVILRRIK